LAFSRAGIASANAASALAFVLRAASVMRFVSFALTSASAFSLSATFASLPTF
jgi:hypothetical protein